MGSLLEKKTIVITGGTSGIGLHSAIGLAKKGHRIIVTGRDSERGQSGVDQIKTDSGNDDIHLALADVSKLSEVKRLGEELVSRFSKIDVLVNNAGHLASERILIDEGIEMSFAVNVVSPIVLTEALLPSLENAKPARVINITGGSPKSKLNIDDLDGAKKFSTMSVYNNSKRALEAATLAQARRLQQKGIYVNLVYPGPASTTMTRAMTSKSLPVLMRPLWPIFSRLMQKDDDGESAKKASRSTVWAAGAEELITRSGLYYNTKSKLTSLSSSVRKEINQDAVMKRIHQIENEKEGTIALCGCKQTGNPPFCDGTHSSL